jgi:hypothetical protein
VAGEEKPKADPSSAKADSVPIQSIGLDKRHRDAQIADDKVRKRMTAKTPGGNCSPGYPSAAMRLGMTN